MAKIILTEKEKLEIAKALGRREIGDFQLATTKKSLEKNMINLFIKEMQ